MTQRRTLARELELHGTGLHLGKPVTMRLLPADAGTGIVFRCEGREIPADGRHAAVSARNTTLTADGVSVHTVEHVLSALRGMGVHDAAVELSGPEPPALDGSALPIAEAIRDAGLSPNGNSAEPFVIRKGGFFHEGRAGIFAVPHEAFRVSFFLHYEHPLIGDQWFDVLVTPDNYITQVAPARTYGFEEELQALYNAGLALGGTLDNAVLVYPDRFSSPLRFPDEFVRHKALDLIGDLALLGRPLQGHVIGFMSGHAMHVRFVKHLMEKG